MIHFSTLPAFESSDTTGTFLDLLETELLGLSYHTVNTAILSVPVGEKTKHIDIISIPANAFLMPGVKCF